MNWQLHRYGSVDSTMTIAAALPLGSVVVADEQTAGIGRHGHAWDSVAAAGLYMSVVLPPHPFLTLALGLAAHAAVRDVTSLVCDIRWPNDLMLNGKKLGGILVQMQDERAVAGIGINIGQRHFPADLSQIATSLALETNLDFRAEDLLDALLARIEPEPTNVIARFERVSTWARGKRVIVDERISGVTAGLDANGFLLLRTNAGGIETILAGGVREAQRA